MTARETAGEFAGHTPGPWTLDTAPTSVGICHKIGPFPWRKGQKNHACVYVDGGVSEDHCAELLANARLIAAAPALLAERDALAAENGRLREALAGLLDAGTGALDVARWDDAARKARKALQP